MLQLISMVTSTELCYSISRYNVALVGVRPESSGEAILLNPGTRHIMKKTDMCFYMSITKDKKSQLQENVPPPTLTWPDVLDPHVFPPPVSPYFGFRPTHSYQLEEPRSLCCLQLTQVSIIVSIQ